MDVQKEAVSVAEMARIVGLSRARFYQLIGATFPSPIYDAATRRPFYPSDLQATCLEVRHRNCGIDGKPVVFYARRMEIKPSAPRRSRKKSSAANEQYNDLTEGLKSLGLVDVTAAQVGATVKQLYPCGVRDVDDGEVLRSVFLAIQRRDSADNLTR
jgi:hypothetical protein